MKQFRIVKETRKKYDVTVTKYFVEETADIPFITWWRRWTQDKAYGTIYRIYNRRNSYASNT